MMELSSKRSNCFKAKDHFTFQYEFIEPEPIMTDD